MYPRVPVTGLICQHQTVFYLSADATAAPEYPFTPNPGLVSTLTTSLNDVENLRVSNLNDSGQKFGRPSHLLSSLFYSAAHCLANGLSEGEALS